MIVAAGVMIALAATGWSERRADRALERRYLDDLVTDLQSDTAQIRAAISLAESRATLGHAVLRAMDGDTALSPQDLVVAVERHFYFAFPAYSRTTIADLMSTGNLRLLRDRNLKRSLSDYYQTVDRLQQWSENWRAVQRDIERLMPELLPIDLRESVITAAAPRAGWNNTWPASPWAPTFQVTEQNSRDILSRLRAHPEARPRIEGMIRIQGNQYGVLTVIRDKALQTLAVVEHAR